MQSFDFQSLWDFRYALWIFSTVSNKPRYLRATGWESNLAIARINTPSDSFYHGSEVHGAQPVHLLVEHRLHPAQQ